MVTVNVLLLFLTVLWLGRLQCVIVVFPDHTHLLLERPLSYDSFVGSHAGICVDIVHVLSIFFCTFNWF